MSGPGSPSAGTPAMSVILATDTWDTILPVIKRLNDLPTSRQLEIVLVLQASQSERIETESLTSFAGVRITHVDPSTPLGAARAAGVRAATAPLVFIGETHSYPSSEMIEALIAAHASGWGVVAPSFANANPDGAASWAGFLTGYASWTDGKPAEELNSAPILNVSYRLSFLLNLGDRLEQALSEGKDMMAELRSAGERVRFEPAARIEHANISFLAPCFTSASLRDVSLPAPAARAGPLFGALATLSLRPSSLRCCWCDTATAFRGRCAGSGRRPALGSSSSRAACSRRRAKWSVTQLA